MAAFVGTWKPRTLNYRCLRIFFIIIFKRSVSQSAPVLYIVIQDVKRHL